MDRYFKPGDRLPNAKAPITGKIYSDHNHPDTMNRAQLAMDLAEAIQENKADVIIAEGLLTLWDDDICKQFDLKLFVECRTDERIVRRLRRNMQSGLTFDEIADVYLDLVRYRHDEYVEPSKWKADFILNGSNFSETALTLIAGAIKEALPK
jgi:uridine kinase